MAKREFCDCCDARIGGKYQTTYRRRVRIFDWWDSDPKWAVVCGDCWVAIGAQVRAQREPQDG